MVEFLEPTWKQHEQIQSNNTTKAESNKTKPHKKEKKKMGPQEDMKTQKNSDRRRIMWCKRERKEESVYRLSAFRERERERGREVEGMMMMSCLTGVPITKQQAKIRSPLSLNSNAMNCKDSILNHYWNFEDIQLLELIPLGKIKK